MQRWHLTALSFTFLALGAASLAPSQKARASARWHVADAQVVSLHPRPLPRGNATFVRGRFHLEGRPVDFEAPWGINTWDGGRWVAPADLPREGAIVRVRYNPERPAEVLLGPARTPSDAAYFLVATVVLVALAVASLVARHVMGSSVREVRP